MSDNNRYVVYAQHNVGCQFRSFYIAWKSFLGRIDEIQEKYQTACLYEIKFFAFYLLCHFWGLPR